MDRAKTLKISIVMILLVVLVVWYYSYLSSKNSSSSSSEAIEKKTASEMTTVEKLIAQADYKEYPSTPVQVLKYYNEVTQCYYNETYTDDQLEELVAIANSLCDPLFVNNQTHEQQMTNLKSEIATFKSGNITIYNSVITSATDVEYFTYDDYECARLYCTYTLKSGTSYQPSREVYIMRKDGEGHWKILGFELVEE